MSVVIQELDEPKRVIKVLMSLFPYCVSESYSLFPKFQLFMISTNSLMFSVHRDTKRVKTGVLFIIPPDGSSTTPIVVRHLISVV